MLSMFLLIIAVIVNTAHSKENRVTVAFDKMSWQLELAVTAAERARGLQNRSQLCETCGMVFIFKPVREVSMWMKDTLIPLDIAFVDAHGQIVAIHSLKPHDLTGVSSKQDIAYVWEMNKGWFSKNGLKIGNTVKISH